MGSYYAYSLSLGPGERDPETVAAELRAALPDALEETLGAGVDLDEVVGEGGPLAWVEDGVVRYTTGRNFRIGWPAEWTDLVRGLPVPSRWALATWQGEAGSAGGAMLYAWVDGEYVLIEERRGRNGARGADVVEDLEREWGVDARERYPVDPPSRVDPVAARREPDPAATPGYEPVDHGDLPSVDAALDALEGSDPRRRRRAAEHLYVRAGEDGDVALESAVTDALADPVTRFPAAATLTEASVTASALASGLESTDPNERARAARVCAVRGLEDAPVDALRDALTDDDAEVRAAAARAFERATVGTDRDPAAFALEDLIAATEDEDPRVRAAAGLGVVRFGLEHDRDEVDLGTDALVRLAHDPDAAVTDRLTAALDAAYGPDEVLESLPDDALQRLPVSLARITPDVDGEPVEPIAGLPAYVTGWLPAYFEPIATDLVRLGWTEDSELARRIVRGAAASDEENRELVREALAAAGVDPDEELDGGAMDGPAR